MEETVQSAVLRPVKRKRSGDRLPKIVWGTVGIIAFLALFGWGVVKLVAPAGSGSTQTGEAGAVSAKAVIAPGMVDTRTKLQAAQEALERKDYAVAEDVFRNIVRAEPTQRLEAIKGLASALFREEKTDEAAAVLDKLPKD